MKGGEAIALVIQRPGRSYITGERWHQRGDCFAHEITGKTKIVAGRERYGTVFAFAGPSTKQLPVLAETHTNKHLPNKDNVMSTAMKTMKTARREYMPSPEEIRNMTAKIRQSWSPEVRAARRRMARNYQLLLLSCNDRSAA